MGIADNIRGFFRPQETVEKKDFGSFPTSQIVYPFNTDTGFFSGADEMSPEGNSAALACLNVLGTAFSEPPLEVYLKTQEGKELILEHPASKLYANPSPYLSSSLLSQYITSAVSVSGDAFILKLRSDGGDVLQLYPLVPEMVEVKGNKEELITHYIYKQKGQYLHIDREDMIHLRERIDPRDHRRGLSPLRAVMVEILGDAAASQMAAALVKNTGVPSVVISPKNELSMTGEEAESIADTFGRRFGGENRGRPLVISGGEVDIKTLSFSPKDLEIGQLRNVNEERISAVLGVPAILAGLGAGLESATYSNVRELREFFTEQKLIPMWRSIANDFTNQLLSDFETNENYSMDFDLSDVRALSQDEDAAMQRVVQGFNAGFLTVNEARQATQFAPMESGDSFIRQMGQVEVPAEGEEIVMYGSIAPEEKGGEAFVYTADGERVHTSWVEPKEEEEVIEEEEEQEEKAIETELVETPKMDLYGWEDPTTKYIGLPTVKHYKSEDQKAAYWKAIDDLRTRWDNLFQTVYAKELNRQRRALAKAASGSSTVDTIQTNIDIVIEDTKFEKELLPLFYSLADDFSVRTYDNLFPKNEAFKAATPADLDVSITEEEAIRTVFDELAALLPQGRSLKKIVENGFYRGQREVPPAVGSVFQDGQAASFLQENAKRVMKELNDTTKKRVSKIVSDALTEFEKLGIVNPVAGTPEGDKFFKELSKNINTALGGQALTRSRAIARTEVAKASSWSQQRAAKSTGKVLEKEWVSQRDDKVREAHFILDNQRVPADSFYLYNGIKLDFPADPKAPASLVVNCRCTEAYIEVIDE